MKRPARDRRLFCFWGWGETIASMRILTVWTFACGVLLAQGGPLRVAIAGLTHGHASGFLQRNLARTGELDVVGISEPDAELRERYRTRFQLPAARMYASHAAMLDAARPEAVMVFTSTFEHKELVELCAKRKIPVMMEKPLAVSMEHARAMEAAAKAGGIPVMVNYETTWYPVNAPIWKMVREEGKLGTIRKIVTHYGHQGPKEINVGPEFLGWLKDPVKNGAGALFDFGCYGINFASWLFDDERPISVTAVTATNKPGIYAPVDDEATFVVQYAKAQLIVQASWNWPYSRKDMEVYGDQGMLITANPRDYRFRTGTMKEESAAAAGPLAAPDDDVVRYLRAVVRDGKRADGLTGLANNLIVTEVLEAARESARTGRTVRLGSRGKR
jgi:predicted dehydrogenase